MPSTCMTKGSLVSLEKIQQPMGACFKDCNLSDALILALGCSVSCVLDSGLLSGSLVCVMMRSRAIPGLAANCCCAALLKHSWFLNSFRSSLKQLPCIHCCHDLSKSIFQLFSQSWHAPSWSLSTAVAGLSARALLLLQQADRRCILT